MLRLADGDGRNGFHQLPADAPTLFGNGPGAVVADGLPKEGLAEPGGQVHGHKADLFARLFIVELGYVNKILLKGAEDLIVALFALREDDDVAALTQLPDGGAEGGDDPGVVVYGDGIAAAHDGGYRKGDDVGHQPEQGMQEGRFFVPEIVIGIIRHLFGAHHLPGTPDRPFSREIELTEDGAMGLGVVAHHNGRLLRQILQPLDGIPGVEYPYQPPHDFIKKPFCPLFHSRLLPFLSIFRCHFSVRS